ncbi:MAG: radical SAM family heme chaperone HemW [Treponema sp.]|nr:radical SAM family heme chaperone HemW [Treponema sp.]
MIASLYIHVPFCAGACDYCDFYSVPVAPEDPRINRYIDTLLAEGEDRINRFSVNRIPSVYIGGGTPSLLGASGIGRLLQGIATFWNEAPQEITVEANPESADEAFLEACGEGGVTRLSLGVQSFHEPSRRAVGRVGAGAVLHERLQLIAERFPQAFSVDLITGLPFQDTYRLQEDIEKALAYKPGHVSLYDLTVEPGTPLEMNARSHLPDRDEADQLWIAGRDTLEQAGYQQYEVSNFALPGNRSRHNIRYWRMENWLGLGPAASGTLIDDETGTGRRFTNQADVDNYVASAYQEIGGLVHEEPLDRHTLMEETFLMGFRYIEGPDRSLFKKRFRLSIEACIPETLAAWRNQGLVGPEPALTKEGLLFLDLFLQDTLTEIEKKFYL